MKKLLLSFGVTLALLLLAAPAAQAGDMATAGTYNTISAGSDNTAVIKTDGSLWAWGNNFNSELADAFVGKYSATPVKMMDGVAHISIDMSHTTIVKTDGTLWTWGWNYNGEVGDGTTERWRRSPGKVLDDVVSVSVGGHTAAIKKDGSLWAWGRVVGDGTQTRYLSPVKVLDGVAAVSAGGKHIIAIKTDGTLWTWGNDSFGEVGDGGAGNEEQVGGTIRVQTVPYQITAFRVAHPASPVATPTVLPSPCAATLDGKSITLNAYLFTEGSGGSNYVMLRDVAKLLSDTVARFEVGWTAKDGITLTTGAAYTPTGSELQSKGPGPKPYVENTNAITINGKAVELKAYSIEGNNYFKLRDLGEALGFTVGWDGANGVVTITTK